MDKKVSSILAHFVRFSEALLGIRKDASPQSSRDFLNALIDFNEDDLILESRPFFFILDSDSTFVLSEAVIMKILSQADELELADEFRISPNREGDQILFFSHKARSFASKVAEKYALGIVNIGANGLCLDNFSCTGLYTITEKELKEAMSTAKIIIQQ